VVKKASVISANQPPIVRRPPSHRRVAVRKSSASQVLVRTSLFNRRGGVRKSVFCASRGGGGVLL
jgi:hypothetical protein